ncbi:MAG: di-trans,poly-cis-decaprenylcistransferase [Clostridia bacterium]|nr:di-trans,poly-cis-decaprenylcistransferase [Clostridia bacterium]
MNKLNHLAIIMDGNGRWATARNTKRTQGHQEGLKKARDVILWCAEMGVPYLSLYVFSTENWKRPQTEVDGLFKLSQQFFDQLNLLEENGVKVVVSGNRAKLPKILLDKMDNVVKVTANNTKICVNLCLNYGGRQEIVCAVNKLIAENKQINEENLLKCMYVDLPEPDLIVRTGGKQRLSNFLLFQGAYAELAFTDTLWPDLTKQELFDIIKKYSNSLRNFGGLGDESTK